MTNESLWLLCSNCLDDFARHTWTNKTVERGTGRMEGDLDIFGLAITGPIAHCICLVNFILLFKMAMMEKAPRLIASGLANHSNRRRS